MKKSKTKVAEEINELKKIFTRQTEKTCLELKSYYDNKEESMKLEIRNLQTQIEHLKKENIDLRSKVKETKFPESTKIQPNIDKLNESY